MEKSVFEDTRRIDVETGTSIPLGADAALAFIQKQAGDLGVPADVDEKKLVRKIDMCIVPL